MRVQSMLVTMDPTTAADDHVYSCIRIENNLLLWWQRSPMGLYSPMEHVYLEIVQQHVGLLPCDLFHITGQQCDFHIQSVSLIPGDMM